MGAEREGALDGDPDVVEEASSAGQPVELGDGERIGLLERIESLIEGLERRLWMTVYGVVAVILTQAVQSILQFAPKGG